MERFYQVRPAEGEDLWVFACAISISSGGALIFDHQDPQDERTVFAPGCWVSVFPADLNTGEPKYLDTFEDDEQVAA